eukprot:COSAG01_NODE_57272_length_313_cov_0.878505_1_plen_81_part_01
MAWLLAAAAVARGGGAGAAADGAMARLLLSVSSSLLLTCTSAIALHVQQRPVGSGDRVALAVAAPTGTAAIATSCSTFHSK